MSVKPPSPHNERATSGSYCASETTSLQEGQGWHPASEDPC